MTKIIDYKIIAESKKSSLENRVCEAISFDWIPYHGPYLDRNGIEKQAMVQYEDDGIGLTSIAHPDGAIEKLVEEFIPLAKPKAKPKKGAKDED